MRKTSWSSLLSTLACAVVGVGSAVAQTQLNPITQINWAAATGSGPPTSYCPTVATGRTTSGSVTVTGLSTLVNVLVNQSVTGAGIQANTSIAAINAASMTAVLTLPATATASGVTLSFRSVGLPYTDVLNDVQYTCSASGWSMNTGSGCLGVNTVANGCTGANTASGALANLNGVPQTPASNSSANSILNNYFNGAGANPPPMPGIVNDACPNSGGANSHMVLTGGTYVCTAGTGPTDNCGVLTAYASLGLPWALPTSNQGSNGWIYTSCTVQQQLSNGVLYGIGGMSIGLPNPGTTVIAVPSTSNIDGVDQSCPSLVSVGGCEKIGLQGINIVSINPSTGVVTTNSGGSTGYCYNGTGPSGHTGRTPYGNHPFLKDVWCSGFQGGVYFYNYAKGTLDTGNAYMPAASTGAQATTIDGIGSNSWNQRMWSAGGHNNQGYIMGMTAAGVGNYLSVGDSVLNSGINLCTNTGSSTGSFVDWLDVETPPVPNQTCSGNFLVGRWAGMGGTPAGVANGAFMHQSGGDAGDLFLVPNPFAYVPPVATDAPAIASCTASTASGTLPSLSYFYIMQGHDPTGHTVSSNEIATSVSCPLGGTGNITLTPSYAATVSGYTCIDLYRGTSSGGELFLHTFCNITGNIQDNGSFGAPSGAPSNIATLQHVFGEAGSNGQFDLIGPHPYIQSQIAGTVSFPGWLYTNTQHEMEWAYKDSCTEVPDGVSITLTFIMRNECFYTLGMTSIGDSDTGPQWGYRNSAGSFLLTPSLTNPTGTGSMVLANAPTTVSINDTGTATFNNITVSGVCEGCTGPVTPQSQSLAATTTGTLVSAMYVSGGTFTNATGTCPLTFPNGTTATLAVTSGVPGTITSVSGGSAVTTSLALATVGTCTNLIGSGTVTVTSLLSSSVQGTGAEQNIYTITIPVLAAGQCVSYSATWARAGTYNSPGEAEWVIGSSTYANVTANTATNALSVTNTIKICNAPGSQSAQTIRLLPAIQGSSIVAADTVYAASLTTSTTNTMTFRLVYAVGDYYNLQGLTVNLGN